MKKILSLLLVGVMVFSMIPAAYATNTYDQSNADEANTIITLVGSQETTGAQWTVTVPAKMVPGDTSTVKAEGAWAADHFLQVKAPETVKLTYGAQSIDVGITFDDIYKIGSSIDELSASADITVAEASTLFGTWEGVLEYDVALIEKGDVNRDGVIDKADHDILLDAYLENIECTEDILTYGDFNNNGKIQIYDTGRLKLVLLRNGISVEESE